MIATGHFCDTGDVVDQALAQLDLRLRCVLEGFEAVEDAD
jgi:hypothetical protein